MCGIIAICNPPINYQDKIENALHTLQHRGPDNYGLWRSDCNRITLGHRRLAIVDLSPLGNQPMHNEDSTIWLTCNGEIYNYPYLKDRLEGLGHTFYSNCDSEVIIHAYEEWKEGCLDKLIGMFSFCLWDENNKSLFAARDHVGIKPLCFTSIGKSLYIASEFRALLQLVSEKPSPDPDAVGYFLTNGYIPSPLSIWKNFFKLEPGHFIKWSEQNGISTHSYWSPPDAPNYDGDYSQTKWNELFEEVLSDHLLSDVPMGFFLSGGLDSSSIAVGLSSLKADLQALTISFPGSKMDEAPLASSLTKKLDISHNVSSINTEDLNLLMTESAQAYDEPFGFSAFLSMIAISQLASKDYKVVLSGDGGDECFGGYTWHYNNLSQNITPHPNRALAFTSNILASLNLRNNKSRFSPNILKSFSFTPAQKYAQNICSRFLPEEVELLMGKTGIKFNNDKWLAPFLKHYSPNLHQLRARQRIDLLSFCSDCILPKVDRASMWNSLEVRVPFLDRRIIEWSLKKPVQQHELTIQSSKKYLRNYIKNRVPQNILNHPKQGFSLKNRDQLDLSQHYHEIDNSWWVKNGFISKNWKDICQRKCSSTNGRIWFLLMLTKWGEHWL